MTGREKEMTGDRGGKEKGQSARVGSALLTGSEWKGEKMGKVKAK